MRRERKAKGERRKAEGIVPRRRGTTYLAVCGMVVLVATISLGGLAATRVRARAGRARNDIMDARLYAVSATEMGRLWIAQDKNWRNDYANGAWFTKKPIGRGSYSLTVTNPNGALNHSTFDPVVLSASAVCGKATQNTQVTLNAKAIPYSCLSTALSASTAIVFNNTTVAANNQSLATNGVVWAIGATVNANVQAVGPIAGGAYNGATTTISTAMTFPDATVLSYYQTNGTSISVGSIPGATIQNILLTPTSNPYGGANANGIYVIDCQGRDLIIQRCRIVGTLVLLNPGDGTQISNSVVWCASVSNYPCLLVNGNLTIKSDGNYLNESGNYNFNPAAAPYPWPSGTSNSTMADSYPPAVTGLIYVSGNLTLQGPEFAANLLVVGGMFSATDSTTLYLNYDPTYYNSPPPGLSIIQMVVSPGSWQQVVH